MAWLFIHERISVFLGKVTQILKGKRSTCPYNRTVVHKSVDFASSAYCERMSCLEMHINSLKIWGIFMKVWFILCPRHTECFSLFFFHHLTLFFCFYYLFTFNNYIYISGIWNLNSMISTILKDSFGHDCSLLHETSLPWTPASVSCHQLWSFTDPPPLYQYLAFCMFCI